jgi:hypothetical protein
VPREEETASIRREEARTRVPSPGKIGRHLEYLQVGIGDYGQHLREWFGFNEALAD